jgi:hypothetical protein
MRPELVDLVEAVRALGLRRTGKPAPGCVRISGDPKDFPSRLDLLQSRLEAVDASGALSQGDGPDAPAPDEVQRLRKALDGLLRYIQVKGVDMEAAVDIVSEAIGVDVPRKREKAYETLPMFAPRGWKRRKRFSPRLKLMPDLPGDVSLGALRALAGEANMTVTMMGSAFAKESARMAEDVERMAAVTSSAPTV